MATVPARKILTVSQVNSLVDAMLQEHFADIWIVGEVSNLKFYESGHIYFTLKDENSQLSAVCFRDAARRLKFTLESGMLILGHGRVEVYVPSGRYQIILDTIEPRGIGALQQAFEQLKRKLEREGLFAKERKRPLPRLPRVIGIITSPSGAAIHDILKTLRLYRARGTVLLYPVQVQGEGAAGQIVKAIAGLSRREDVEVIILGRGGGSIEDLWPFNEEPVARAIAASRVPIVTGIGHEVDFTIADFVADFRAATPTAAAQAVAQGWSELEERISLIFEELVQAIRDYLFNYEQRVEELSRHRAFELVMRRLGESGHQADIYRAEMVNTLRRILSRYKDTLTIFSERLNRQNPVVKIRQRQLALADLKSRLLRVLTAQVTGAQNRLARLGATLDALSPLASLARGYALCFKSDGTLVRKIVQVATGEVVFVRLSDGRLQCEVKNRIKGEENGEQKQ
jgi:exodeoxyribonuclease VII large subunit